MNNIEKNDIKLEFCKRTDERYKKIRDRQGKRDEAAPGALTRRHLSSLPQNSTISPLFCQRAHEQKFL